MNVLIIEDEPLARIELKRLLRNCSPELTIVAELDSVEDSVEYLKKELKPDLIFMDIELSDGISFDIFEQVTVKEPVIFTTAYNEFAIKAFKVNSIDYLLKPIEEEPLQAAITKLVEMRPVLNSAESEVSAQNLASLLRLARSPEQKYKSRFMVSFGDKIRHVDVGDIAYFFAEENTVFLQTRDKRKFVISQNLEQLEGVLNPLNFFRLNRKFIANISAVAEVNRYFNSRLKVGLVPAVEDDVLVSRVRVPEFLKWMDS